MTDLLPAVPCATRPRPRPWRTSARDRWRKIMACHYSPEGSERPCIGYVAQEGLDNIWVRILAATGRIDLGGILSACADLDLWPSFGEMLAAYEAAR